MLGAGQIIEHSFDRRSANFDANKKDLHY